MHSRGVGYCFEKPIRGDGDSSLNHLSDIQKWLQGSPLSGLVIPSTDEFLSEFTPPANKRLLWTTGFRGSTGLAVILRNAAALFVDGRYRQQAAVDTEGAAIVIEPATLDSRRAWLARLIAPRARLGLDPWLHSAPEVTEWRSLASELGFELELLAKNPIDSLWSHERPPEHRPPIVDYPVRYAGEAHSVKCDSLIEHVRKTGLQALLVADPEDVSWLLNIRAAPEAHRTQVDEMHIVPSCISRAMVKQDGSVIWFVELERLDSKAGACNREHVTIERPERLATALREAARHGPIGADLHRTPAALITMIEEGKVSADDTVARRRWRKHAAELQSVRRVHIIDAVAVVRFMAWLTDTLPKCSVSEIDAAERLEAIRAEHPDHRGPSEASISASGPSGAEPHYVPRRHACRRLNDHPIFLMDSGGHYLGGSTDNTFTLALGTPELKHVLAHTLVLKANIALATARFPVNTPAFRLDTIARQVLWQEGMDYAHGTGHGVGNYLNIHEGPVIRPEPRPISTVPLEPGMIVTNEPGYYANGDFGMRIESHMIVTLSIHPKFLEFEIISRLPIDPHLVDFERLSLAERRWLADYHRTVLQDLEPLLDGTCVAWLRAFVLPFVQASKIAHMAGHPAEEVAEMKRELIARGIPHDEDGIPRG